MTPLLIGILFGALISGGIGYALGDVRKRGELGFWLGAFLGPIGWVLVLLIAISDQQVTAAPAPKPAAPPAPAVVDLSPYLAPKPARKPSTKAAEGRWLYLHAGGQAGPVGRSQILALAQSGTIPRNTPVIHEGDTKWRTVADLEF